MANGDIIEIPDFDFSGFYYPEIFRSLLQFKRTFVPEITDENPNEPFIQLLSAFALVAHLNNVLLDIAATETLLPTSRLLESVKGQLALIDVRLSQAKPAQADVILEFSKVFLASTNIVPINSQFATVETEENPQIIYETDLSFTITPTDNPTSIFTFTAGKILIKDNAFDGGDKLTIEGVDFRNGIEWTPGGTIALTLQAITDSINNSVADEINGRVFAINDGIDIISIIPLAQDVESISIVEDDGATDNFDVLSGGFGLNRVGLASTDGLFFDLFDDKPKAGDIIYINHLDILWDTVEFVFNSFGSGIEGVWEFFDNTLDDDKPDSVTNLGSNLEFDLTDFLGTSNRKDTVVRVVLSATGASETVVSTFTGGKNIITTKGLLGQAVVDLDEQAYVVGSVWNEVANTNDLTSFFTADGKVSFDLPQNQTQNWISTIVNSLAGSWSRFRVTKFTETAASITGTGFDGSALDTSNFNIKIKVDAFAETEIDVTGDAGVSSPYTISTIVSNINAALTVVDASLSSVASDSGGQLKLTSPIVGGLSLVRLVAPSGNDATFEILGLSETSFPHENIGIGKNPNVDRIRIDTGKQFLLVPVVQGQSVAEDPLASSNGTPDQAFLLTFNPIIEGTLIVEANEGSGFQPWNIVENFLNSTSVSKDLTVTIAADDQATIKFGDGTRGKIPLAGVDNIRAIYRIGADNDGNVGAETITVNKSGISFVDRIFNPRQAKGFTVKEGSTDEDLARLKIEGPATLRTRGRAITIPDFEFLATQFTAASGSEIVSRALGIEETFGVKTIELVVVGQGGILLTEAERTELTDFFNGNKVLGISPIILSNHEVTIVNFTPKIIDVVATVTGGNEEQIKNAITSLLNPEATFDDGVTKRWEFGQEIPFSVIIAEIFEVDPVNIKKVVLTTPSADVVLATRELPIAGTVTVSVI